MFQAVCSRTSDQRTITADEAYSKFGMLDDWGYIQTRDGWVCPECRQPVFLKGPHERILKGYSFIVHAHFCHHSAAVAQNCALFRAGGLRALDAAQGILADRRQSLKRFFGSEHEFADFIATLLSGEEEVLRDTAIEIGVAGREYVHQAEHVGFNCGSPSLKASQIHTHLEELDSFLAGVFSLGVDHMDNVCTGFLAVKGRKNKLRSMFINFGKNRKQYFQQLIEAGLAEEHDMLAEKLVGQVMTEVEAVKLDGLLTYHGMSLRIVESILHKIKLVDPGEQPGNCIQHLQALPLLGNKVSGFERICLDSTSYAYVMPTASSGKQKAPVNPPIRITAKRKLLIEAKVIQQLAEEGAERDGFTSFITPGLDPLINSYLLIPGDGCFLLTSDLHSDRNSASGFTRICPEIILDDVELPSMIWDQRICLMPRADLNSPILVNNETVLAALEASSRTFGRHFTAAKVGLRYRRLHSGLRINIIDGQSD